MEKNEKLYQRIEFWGYVTATALAIAIIVIIFMLMTIKDMASDLEEMQSWKECAITAEIEENQSARALHEKQIELEEIQRINQTQFHTINNLALENQDMMMADGFVRVMYEDGTFGNWKKLNEGSTSDIILSVPPETSKIALQILTVNSIEKKEITVENAKDWNFEKGTTLEITANEDYNAVTVQISGYGKIVISFEKME